MERRDVGEDLDERLLSIFTKKEDGKDSAFGKGFVDILEHINIEKVR